MLFIGCDFSEIDKYTSVRAMMNIDRQLGVILSSDVYANLKEL